MSETQTPQPADTPAPQESLAAEDNEDATKPLERFQGQSPGQSDGEEPPEQEQEQEKRQKEERRREAQRISHLTRERYRAQSRAEEAERRAQELEQRLRQMENPGGQPQPVTAQDVDRLAEQKAAAFVAEQQRQAKINDWDKAGREAFGDGKFSEACKTVADLASDEQRRVLLHVAMDVEGGQRAVVQMAEDAALAERILSLPPHKMSLELAKLGAPPPPEPKPVSKAPPPIRPPAGGRASTTPDPHGSWEQFQKWSKTVPWRR